MLCGWVAMKNGTPSVQGGVVKLPVYLFSVVSIVIFNSHSIDGGAKADGDKRTP